MSRPLLLVSLVSLLLLRLAPAQSLQPNAQPPSAAAVSRLQSIDHFIVLMFENESFDQLFPDVPGSESVVDWQAGNSRNGIPYFQQTDASGAVYPHLSPPLCSGVPCGSFPSELPNAPFLASLYWGENVTTTYDVTHRYYQEQWQMNGGAMDHYVLWGAQSSSSGQVLPTGAGWAMEHWDVDQQYLGMLAQNFTLFDSLFHSYFGGSTPGALSVFAGYLPFYNGSDTGCPEREVAAFSGGVPTADGSGFLVDGALDSSCRMINDVCVAGFGTCTPFVQTDQQSIGDLLTEAGVSWAWYAQNWDLAVAQRPAGLPTAHFAYHHHAPLYFTRFENLTGSEATTHLLDESVLFAQLAAGSGLPQVSYVRPSPDDDMHPAQNNPVLAQAHLQAYMEAVFSSAYYTAGKLAVFITFDENGGYFDHVSPYTGDADGPGTRIPALLVSPYHAGGGVNSFPYENLSFLKLLQTRFSLPNSTIAPARVDTVRDLSNSFAEPASAQVLGDPQFSGFYGQQYQVHGIAGLHYNLLTMRDLQMNSRFTFMTARDSMRWHDMKTARISHERRRLRLLAANSMQKSTQINVTSQFALPVTKAWTHDGTYLTEIGIKLASSHRVYLRAGGFLQGIQQMTVDGVSLSLGESVKLDSGSHDGQVSVTLATPHVVKLTHPAFILSFVNSDGFFNLEGGQLSSELPAGTMDGLLGQTADAAWVASSSQIQREHQIFDYLVDSDKADAIWSSDFVRSKFAHTA